MDEDDLEFATLMDMARDVIRRAGRNFDDGDEASSRYRAFLAACVGEAAQRAAVCDMKNAETIFATYLDFWRAMQSGEEPPLPPPLALIKGGKD
jgi:hypothetical protein